MISDNTKRERGPLVYLYLHLNQKSLEKLFLKNKNVRKCTAIMLTFNAINIQNEILTPPDAVSAKVEITDSKYPPQLKINIILYYIINK